MWITSKYESRCTECNEPIEEGERMVWDPQEQKAYCSSCGEEVDGDDPITLSLPSEEA